ncbi:Uncharacterized protein YfgD, not an arsenate reductase [hydrothermal vent metagenome]|uniref:Uncharacterized protein YfgD, not an arsenate reductase n=1 Tax=hydrothermal vent metagenome TaxID=652676 RepID=A0A3B1D547_9ZZZZ
MNKNIIFHNPRCSKSRQTLELLKEKGIEIEIVEYLENPPSKEDLKFICEKLGVDPIKLIRIKENIFKELNLTVEDERSDDNWMEIMLKNPALIERPIVVYNKKVALGRPPENVLAII